MSGHSKWSTIKRQKALTDKTRGQLFTKLANSITVAVREGGGVTDAEANVRLRLAIEKARAANMPKDNIERAIVRASGKGKEGSQLTEVLYEGFGPNHVAVLAEGVTDNTQRSSQAVKNVFMRHGGTLGGTGSVAYLFERVGEIQLANDRLSDDYLELGLEVGATDIEENGDQMIMYTKPQDVQRIKEILVQKGFQVFDAAITYKPRLPLELNAAQIPPVSGLLSALEELDDIHKAYTNAQFPKFA